jgi:ATP-binding cassette subfamily B protein
MTTRGYLWRLFLYQPRRVLLDLGNRTFFSLTFQAEGLLTRAFFDWLSGSETARLGPWSIVALLVAARLARIGILLYGVGLSTGLSARISGLLQRNMLARVLDMPGARALPGSSGEAVSRFRDDANEIGETMSNTLHVVGFVLFAAVAVYVMLQINRLITLVIFVPLAGVVVLVQALRERIERYRRASRGATGQVTEALGEMFGAAQAIQVAGAEERVVARFQGLNDTRRHATVRDRLFTEVLNSIWSNAVNVGTGVILLLAADSMRAGTPPGHEAAFTVGDFALFVFYLGFLAELPRQVGVALTRFKQAGVSFQRMQAVMQGAPPEALVDRRRLELPPPPPAEPLELLEAVGLTYHYPESGRGIADVTLRLPRGSFTVVTGRIGAGKTTLLRTLLGLLPPERTAPTPPRPAPPASGHPAPGTRLAPAPAGYPAAGWVGHPAPGTRRGEVRWNGKLVDPATFLVPPRAAYTAQVPRLFSESLRDNIVGGLGAADLEAAVRAAVLEEDVAAMEHGYETLVGPRGVRLSGGQVQRAAAARMLAREAELLVVDDLSSALDVDTERVLWERLAGRRDATFLVVSHRRAVLRRADRVLVLRDGRVEDEGRLEELLVRCAEMRRLWQEEAEQPVVTSA